MRDLLFALLAVFLLFVALALAATLHVYRRRREAARVAAAKLGRRIVAELPVGPDLTLFAEDATAFHFGERRIDKSTIRAARVLVNGMPLVATVSPRFPEAAQATPAAFDAREEGIARDRWDVAIDTTWGTVLIECGAIRERISQELARSIYDAVAAAVRKT